MITTLRRRCSSLSCSGRGECSQRGLLGGGDIVLRTEGKIGVCHSSGCRVNQAEGCAQAVVIGYCRGQSLRWEHLSFLFTPLG